VDCVREGQRTVRRPTTVAGGRVAGKPLVTPVLMALNVIVFGITAAQAGSVGDNQDSSLFNTWTLLPPAVANGEFWRLFTSGFLHFGPAHLVLNMLALWMLGRELEPALGRLRFTAVYLLSLLGGGVAAYVFGAAFSNVAGASGAIFGLMGAMLVVLLRRRSSPGPVMTIIALNVFISITVPGISLLGHIGGLVVGALITAGLLYAPRERRNAWQAGAVVAVLLVLLSLVPVRNAQVLDAGLYVVPCGDGVHVCIGVR
jgi:membrane associated rhomboid family serine protease